MPPAAQDREDGRDAVCFTAGPQGIPFSAGLIHAWLAADRKAPKAAAGISSGALSAAALERCYQELNSAPANRNDLREVKRWDWFRRYLNEITFHPLRVIWNAIPQPADFMADRPPVSDPSVPELLRQEELEARNQHYRLVKLGLWLTASRVTVRDVANLLVSRVRYKEQYGNWMLEGVKYWAGLGWLLSKVVLQLALSPKFIAEKESPERTPYVRPLFGWWVWLLCSLVVLDVLYGVFKAAAYAAPWFLDLLNDKAGFLAPLVTLISDSFGFAATYVPFLKSILPMLYGAARYESPLLTALMVLFLLTIPLLAFSLMSQKGGPIRYLFLQLGIERGLLHRYSLHRGLFELFRKDPDDPTGPVVGTPDESNDKLKSSMHLLIVAAPLKKQEKLRGQQVWAAPGTPVVDALLAALAVPGVFPPLTIREPEKIKKWISPRKGALPTRIDLIDAAAVRENPLPAFFAWLKGKAQEQVAPVLTGEGVHDAGIYLCYAVPTEGIKRGSQSKPIERVDIVTAAFSSRVLAQRRDTRMEARQTNFISELELWTEKGLKSNPARAESDNGARLFPIFVDEIAPKGEIEPGNLSPTREQLLQTTAEGCRRSLEVLYRNQVGRLKPSKEALEEAQKKGELPTIDCANLLRVVAGKRIDFIKDEAPGLPELCAQCTKQLAHRPLVIPETPAVKDFEKFKPLWGEKPRIVFLASGGVFRGAFHIGVIGAMQAARMRPDLIVGASVGALMGGALGAISKLQEPDKYKLLAKLALTFLHVDREIALTRTLKNAAKQIGVRGRSVDLSPFELRRAVRRGTKADPGYAVTGAPPALIDAISTLFLIPHSATQKIAREFVAGHFSKAMGQFWSNVRKETLRRLDIENALMGTSLLENAARTLFGEQHGMRMDTAQPFHDVDHPDESISFFSVTCDLLAGKGLVLDRDLETTHSYDFVKAGLSSSAFPAVFSPRQEAEVLPGCGKTDILYSDGGMFDNLPFFPAIEVLSSVQKQYRAGSLKTAKKSLDDRSRQPDLFIAAALESDEEPPGHARDIRQIIRRAGTLKVNVKLDSFEQTSRVVAAQTQDLLAAWSHGTHLPERLRDFMDEMVPAAVLKIAPADEDHLNKTFAFCSAAGFKPERVALSIADGCFQTLKGLAGHETDSGLLATSMQKLQEDGRILRVETDRGKANGRICPFYRIDGKYFPCPFVEATGAHEDEDWAKQKKEKADLQSIYSRCVKDPKHNEDSKHT